MADKKWRTYEEVAAHLLDQFATHFGVGRFEGKQVAPGNRGTSWEIDAKGCSDSGEHFIVVECTRFTKSGVSQAIAAGTAFVIQDTGASGGIIVSPCGLQAGAANVAKAANIIPVELTEDSTTTDYLLKFLKRVCIGRADQLHVTVKESLTIKVTDQAGTVVEEHKII